METLKDILQIIGVLAIPSLLWNVFLYRQNMKYKKWDAEKNLKRLNVQRGMIESDFDNNSKKLSMDYKNLRHLDFDTDSERFSAWEKERGLLQERKNEDLNRIDADIDYFEKIYGQETSPILFKATWREKAEGKISKLWQSIKQKN